MKKRLFSIFLLLLAAVAVRAESAALHSEPSAGSRLVKDGWLYQVMGAISDDAPDTPSYCVARSRLDDLSHWETVFGPASHYIGYLCDLGGEIAFMDNTHFVLYAVPADGGDARRLWESPSPVEAVMPDGDEIWLCADDGLYRWRDGEPVERVYGARHRLSRFSARLGEAFLLGESAGEDIAPEEELGLFLVDREGAVLRQLTEGEPGSFIVRGGTLYAVRNVSGSETFTAATDLQSGETRVLCDRAITFRQFFEGCYLVGERADGLYHLRLYPADGERFDPDAAFVEMDDREFPLIGCMAFVRSDSSITLTPFDEWLAERLRP